MRLQQDATPIKIVSAANNPVFGKVRQAAPMSGANFGSRGIQMEPVKHHLVETDALNLSAQSIPDGDVLSPDQVTVTNLSEPSGGDKFKKWFFGLKHEGGRIHGSPFQKLALGTVVAAGAWTAARVVGNLANSPSVGVALGTAALDVVGLGAGWMVGDTISGLMHHAAENYVSPEAKNPIVRKLAKQAHRHHYHPSGLGDYTVSAWAFPHSLITWAPLVAGNLLNVPSPIMCAALTTVAATSVYGLHHMYAHKKDEDVPAYHKAMQKMGLAVTRREHAEHHAKPWNSDYCMVTNHMNKLFDKIDFWPKYEKAIFDVTGKEPDAWKMKDYKAYALGEISKEEYMNRQQSVSQDFKTEIFQSRKPTWGVD